MAGAIIGATTMIIVSWAMILTEPWGPCRSRTTARASTMPAAPPAACTMRPMISICSDSASAHIRVPSRNNARPSSRIGRRP